MRTGKKILLATFAATLLFSLVASTASALRSIQINERSIHVTFGVLEFTDAAASSSIRCPVTLRIVFNEDRIAKIGREIGRVESVQFGRCTERNGFAVSFTPLSTPWVVLFAGINGTLPTITAIRFIIRRTQFLISAGGGLIRCLYEGDIAGTAEVRAGTVGRFRAEPTPEIPRLTRLAGSIECLAAGRFVGEAGVVRLRDLLGGVTVRLI